MQSKLLTVLALAGGMVLASEHVQAIPLYSNGPFVTSPNGGTGVIAGQPLSRAETYNAGATLATTGVGAGSLIGVKMADDFTVPAGGWDLDTITVYGFQTYSSSATTFDQTVTKVFLNLWTATPYTADSPDLPPGTPIPQPMLAQPLEFDVTGQGTFVAHRVSGSETARIRPVYSWTVSADAFPNGGRLEEGTYWLEMSFEGDGPQTDNVFVPLVTPRDAVSNHNARQYTRPFSNYPVTWFEGREGYVSASEPGRGYAIPFELTGVPEPTGLVAVVAPALLALRRRRNR